MTPRSPRRRRRAPHTPPRYRRGDGRRELSRLREGAGARTGARDEAMAKLASHGEQAASASDWRGGALLRLSTSVRWRPPRWPRRMRSARSAPARGRHCLPCGEARGGARRRARQAGRGGRGRARAHRGRDRTERERVRSELEALRARLTEELDAARRSWRVPWDRADPEEISGWSRLLRRLTSSSR